MKIMIILYLILFAGMASANELFNLEIELPETYEEVLAGENIWFTTKLINPANTERMNVTLNYQILDSERVLKASKFETVAVDMQTSFVGYLRVPENLEEGLYFLKVILTSPSPDSESEISFDMIKEETKPWTVIKSSLFDITVDIPDKYKKVYAGDELLANIKLINLGSAGRVDVFLDYSIADSEGNVILKKKETVAVETQANFVRTFDIRDDAEPGIYHIYANIIYADGKEAVSDHSFEIMGGQTYGHFYLVFAGIVIIALLGYAAVKIRPVIEKVEMKAKIANIVDKRMHNKKEEYNTKA